MLKRITFYVLLLAIPVSVATALSYAYFTYQKRVTELNYQQELEKQKGQFKQELTRYVEGARQYPNGPASVVEDDVKGYVENWERVNAWVPMPGTTGNYQPNVRGKYVNTNDLGYRGTVNFRQQIAQAKKEKAQGKRVVVLLGASAAFGLYSEDDSSDILTYMKKKSAENDNKLVFYNFANGSNTSAEELAALVTYARMLNPDLVVIFDGYADALRISDPGVYHMGIGVPFTYYGIRQYWPIKFASEWLDKVYDPSALSPEDEREFYDHYTGNMRMISRIMKNTGGTVVLTTQPYMQFRNACYRALQIPEASEVRHVPNMRRVYPKLIATARAIAEEEKFRYLDLSNVFEDERCRGAFVDGVHMSSAGQKIVAEKLYEQAVLAINSLEPPAAGK